MWKFKFRTLKKSACHKVFWQKQSVLNWHEFLYFPFLQKTLSETENLLCKTFKTCLSCWKLTRFARMAWWLSGRTWDSEVEGPVFKPTLCLFPFWSFCNYIFCLLNKIFKVQTNLQFLYFMKQFLYFIKYKNCNSKLN